MKVLFIGGTGIISSACSRLSVERGIDLYLLQSGHNITANTGGGQNPERRHSQRDISETGDWRFEVRRGRGLGRVHAGTHRSGLKAFRNRTDQFIFISSASAYQTPPVNLPVTESTPLDNPYWEYSRAKIACEERLMRAYREEKFPMTIARPSHTYDCTSLPMHGGYTIVDRMRKGKKVIVHGDGSSLWF